MRSPIALRRLREFWESGHADAEQPLRDWYKAVERAEPWASIIDVRKTFPSADGVVLDCGIVATVFNIGGNNYRLIASINYKAQIVFIKEVLTHADYDTDRWKGRLCRQLD